MKRFGQIVLSAYIMKKIKPGGSQKSRGPIDKYGKLVLGAYLLEKLKSEKEAVSKMEPEKVKLNETSGGSSKMKTSKILMGMLVGATAIYAFKKYSAKKSGKKIKVQ